MENTLASETVVKIEKFLKHPIEKVWNAISDGSEISKWFMQSTLQPTPGAAYEATGKPQDDWDGRIYGEVVEVEPPHKLVHTFQTNELECPMRVTWTLEERTGGTLLILLHEDFDKLSNAEFMFRDISGGWNYHVENLTTFLQRVEG